MSADKTYNGWTNYETWAVALWIDNEQSTQEYWREEAVTTWLATDHKAPNQFMDHSANAQSELAELLKNHIEGDIPESINGTMYADLLNGALSEVNWHEIAESLLESAEVDGYESQRVK